MLLRILQSLGLLKVERSIVGRDYARELPRGCMAFLILTFESRLINRPIPAEPAWAPLRFSKLLMPMKCCKVMTLTGFWFRLRLPSYFQDPHPGRRPMDWYNQDAPYPLVWWRRCIDIRAEDRRGLPAPWQWSMRSEICEP